MALAILAIHGMLVDTNYHFTIARLPVFHEHGIVLPMWRISSPTSAWAAIRRRAPSPIKRIKREQGDLTRDAPNQQETTIIGEVQPMQGPRELIEQLRRGHSAALANSRRKDDVDHYRDLLDAR